jgi:hypothetical protein
VNFWLGRKLACTSSGCSLPDLLVTVDTDTVGSNMIADCVIYFVRILLYCKSF